MGGFGSGRQHGKKCVDNVRRLDVRPLQRQTQLYAGNRFALTWGRGSERTLHIEVGADSVTLSHWTRLADGDWEEIAYRVDLSWTACTYGGCRAWWLCPASGCGRRVAVLYDGSKFACRHCQRLAYRSQRETEDQRALRMANNLRAKLGWVRGIINDDGVKPKGMHWRTYNGIRMTYHTYARKFFDGMSGTLRSVQDNLAAVQRQLRSDGA
jgi:hypothetical protein